MSATILNMMREDSSLSLGTARPDRSTPKSGRTLSALVKVWSVMKGSLEDVTDKSRQYKRFKRSSGKFSFAVEICKC